MKPETVEIRVSALTVGDVIVGSKGGRTEVKKITPCSQTVLRGIPKIHVNDTQCYDTISMVEVEETS